MKAGGGGLRIWGKDGKTIFNRAHKSSEAEMKESKHATINMTCITLFVQERGDYLRTCRKLKSSFAFELRRSFSAALQLNGRRYQICSSLVGVSTGEKQESEKFFSGLKRPLSPFSSDRSCRAKRLPLNLSPLLLALRSILYVLMCIPFLVSRPFVRTYACMHAT